MTEDTINTIEISYIREKIDDELVTYRITNSYELQDFLETYKEEVEKIMCKEHKHDQ